MISNALLCFNFHNIQVISVQHNKSFHIFTIDSFLNNYQEHKYSATYVFRLSTGYNKKIHIFKLIQRKDKGYNLNFFLNTLGI